MAALPGGGHAAGAADPMQVDQPRPVAAAAAPATADAKVSRFPPLAAGAWFQPPVGVAPEPPADLPEPAFRFFPSRCLAVPAFDPRVDLRRAPRG
jgi:hypothetical protein